MNGMKRVGWLLAGVAAAVAAHLAIDMKTDCAPQGLGRRALVPDAEKAIMFHVARAGEPGTRLVAATRAVASEPGEGGWKIALPYPADAGQSVVLRLSDALAFAPVADEMTDAELLRLGRTREDFGLDNARAVVTVGWPGEVAVRVCFGNATPAGDGVYATVGEGDTVYVVSSNVFAAANLGTADFRRRRVFAFGQDDVASFDIKNGPGRFLRFTREGEAWRLVEPHANRASSPRIREFLDTLLKLEATGFVWPTGATNETAALSEALLAGYGFLADSAVAVTLKCANGKDGTLGFGSDAGKGQVYALAPGGSIVTVPAAVRDAVTAGAGAFVDTRLFPTEAKAVNAISIEDGGTAHLLSRDAEGAWRLDAPVSAAADAKAVEALVARILALQIQDIATNGVRVSVGTNAEPFAVSRTALLADTRLEDLRSKTIVKIEPKNVKRLVVTDHEAKPVAVVFDGERNAWNVESAEGTVVADGEAAGRLAEALNPLKAVRVARLKVSASELGLFGLDKPQRTVAVDQAAEGSVRRNVLVGDVTDGGRYATLGSSDAVFVISAESAAALLAPIVK